MNAIYTKKFDNCRGNKLFLVGKKMKLIINSNEYGKNFINSIVTKYCCEIVVYIIVLFS